MTLREFSRKYEIPCIQAIRWIKENDYTMEEAWENCEISDWLLWGVIRIKVDGRLVRRVLARFESGFNNEERVRVYKKEFTKEVYRILNG